MFLRLAPPLAILLLALPVLTGLAGTLAPAFGIYPALGAYSFSLQPFHDLLATPGFFQSVWLSLKTALITTAISLLIVALAFAAWSGTPAFARMRHFLSPLLSVPHSAVAFGFAFLIAPSGFFSRLISPGLTGWERPPDILILNDPGGWSMIAALIVKEVPFLFLVALAALPQTGSSQYLKVTQSLGSPRTIGWLLVIWPLIYRQIRLPVAAVIAYACSVVDVALILGPTTPPTLAVRVLQWMADAELSLRLQAAAGALVQGMVALLALAIWFGCERLVASFVAKVRSGRHMPEGQVFHTILRRTAAFFVLASAFLVGFSILTLIVWSFAGLWRFPDVLPSTFTLNQWSRRLPQLGDPIWTTSLIGIIATLVASIIALGCLEREARQGLSARKKKRDRFLWLIYLPLLVPQIAFLFGLQVFFISFGIDGSLGGVIFTHLIFVMPYVLLSMSDPWRAWDPRYGQLSAGLGKSPNAVFWRVRVPMLLAPIATAAAVGFAASIGQYLPTLLIGGGRVETITTEAVALAAGGNRRVIGIYAFLQMLLPFIGFLLAVSLPAFIHRNRQAMKTA